MSKKVLVCGATGFIGRNTAEFLSKREDFEVYGTYHNSQRYDNSRINLENIDLTDKDAVRRIVKGKDVIVQAAAACSGALEMKTKPYYHVVDNVRMNPLIFEAAHEFGVPYFFFPIFTTVYLLSDKPLKEEDFNLSDGLLPNYLWCGGTKVFLEKLCELFSGLGNTRYTVFRHSNVYGPYDKFDLERSHVFGATMTKVMTAKDGGEVVVWGDGEGERDLLYSSDIAGFIERAIDRQTTPFEIVNVGCESAISIKNLVQKIIDISGKNLSIKYDLYRLVRDKKTKKNNERMVLDSTKAREKFGWQQQTALDDGIRYTMEWYKKNILAT